MTDSNNKTKKEGTAVAEDTGGRIKVHIRLKLTPDNEKAATYNIYADGSQLQIPNTDGRLELDRWYRFDHIFPTIASNKEVYRTTGYDLVETSLKGTNSALFAYGQSGSGKTNTLMSKDGVMTHMVSHLFHRIWKSVNEDIKVSFSYFQIHNERIYDLLNTDTNSQELVIKEDSHRGVYVENGVRVVCETPMDVYELMNAGRKALMVGEAKGNRVASRSHTVSQISIEKKRRNAARNRRSMQEFSTAIPQHQGGAIAPEGAEGGAESEMDFATVPFTMKTFKQRNSTPSRMSDSRMQRTSVSKMSSASPGRSPAQQRRKSRTKSPDPGLQRSKTSPGNLQRERANSLRSRRPSSRDPSASMDLSRSSCLPLSRKAWEKAQVDGTPRGSTPHRTEDASIVTIVNSIGLDNMKALGDYMAEMEDDSSGTIQHHVPFIQLNPDEFDESMDTETNDSSYQDTDRGACLGSSATTGTTGGCESSFVSNISSDGVFMGEEAQHTDPIIFSKISIIDLAGSERLSDGDRGDAQRLKENQNLNLSLLALGNVISALTAGGKKKHVPYRSSMLTKLLQDTLGGNCKTNFILTTSTKLADVNETKCTLEFGQKLMDVVNKPVLNYDIDWQLKYEALKKQMDLIKQGENAIIVERNNHIEAYESEIEQAKNTIREQELLIVLLQTKMNTADMEQKKHTAKIAHLHKMIEEKDNTLATQDVEILKQKVEMDVLEGKLAAKNIPTEDLVVETVKYDVGTNTPVQDVTVVDAVDGSIRLINYAEKEEDENETTGVFYLPGYRKCLDVIRFSDNNFSIMPYKSMDKSLDSFSECGFFIETKDACTNTPSIERRQRSTNTDPIPPPPPPTPTPPSTPIIVTFLQSPKKPPDVLTRQATTNTPRTAVYDVTRISQDRRDSGYRGSLIQASRDVDCSTQTDIAIKYVNVDRVRSAILVELLSLQKLCQRSKSICDDPLFQNNQMLNAYDNTDYYSGLQPETESICDGLSSVIAEIFNILPNMFNEDSRPTRHLSSYYSDSDIGYANDDLDASCRDVKQSRPKEQLVFLRDYLRNRKKAVDKELLHIAYEITATHDTDEQRLKDRLSIQNSDAVLEKKIIEGLMEKLSGRSLLPTSSLESLKKLLNVILCDHTITACLLALTQKQNLYYYNYNETDFDLMSNSTIESGEFNNNNSNNKHNNSNNSNTNSNNNSNTISNNNNDHNQITYSYLNDAEDWPVQRIPRTPETINTYDIDEGHATGKRRTRLNKLLCMPFKTRKAYESLRGTKPKNSAV